MKPGQLLVPDSHTESNFTNQVPVSDLLAHCSALLM